ARGLQILPPNLSNQLSGRRGHPGGVAEGARSSLPQSSSDSRASGSLDTTDKPSDGQTLGPDPGQQAQWGTVSATGAPVGAANLSPARDGPGYVPQLSVGPAGRLTQSTFTLEQPRGQFRHLNISDSDPIWLVVAHGKGGTSQPPQGEEDLPAPADLPRKGYCYTLRAPRGALPRQHPQQPAPGAASWQRYPLPPRDKGLQPPTAQVRFLVISSRGLWLRQSGPVRPTYSKVLQAAPGPQSPGTVLITAVSCIMLAGLLYAWYECAQLSPRGRGVFEKI
ncbi:Uroplakin-3b-like protein 1, partial [Galemys pyrenaicus]